MLISGPSRALNGSRPRASRRVCSTAKTAPMTPSAVTSGDSSVARETRAPAPVRPWSMTSLTRSQDLGASFEHPRTGAERLDDAHPRETGLVVHEAQEREQAGADAVAPARLGQVGLADELRQLVDGLIEGGEEAVLAILEEVVEGLARDARAPDHLRNGQACIADLLDGLDGGRQHPGALDLGHLSSWHAVGPRTQARVLARVLGVAGRTFRVFERVLSFVAILLPPNHWVLSLGLIIGLVLTIWVGSVLVGAFASERPRGTSRQSAATCSPSWRSTQRFMG